MTALPKTIRQSELTGRLVISRDSMEELGHVDVVWMHPPVHRVFGFICSSGFLGRKKSAFNLPQLHTVGEDGVLVNSAPVPTDSQKVRQIESLLGYELWTDSGEKVGHVVDYVFDTKTGAIQAYLFTSHPLGALTDGLYKLTPRQMLSYGDRRIRVRNQVLESPVLYKPGLKQKIVTVKESVLESAEDEWRSLTEQALTLREQALERWQTLTDQAKNQVMPQAKDKAQVWKERGLGFVERFREQTQSYTEHLRTEFDEKNWNLHPDQWPTAAEKGDSGEYRWDDRAADELWQDDSGEFSDEFDDEFSDEFDDEFDDWDESAVASTTQPETAANLADSEENGDEEDEDWDTWDLDEPSNAPQDVPSRPTEEGSPSEPQRDRPHAEVPHEPVSDQSDQEVSAEEPSPDDIDLPTENQIDEEGAIASTQPNPPIQTEPIPPEDLEDDDPWI